MSAVADRDLPIALLGNYVNKTHQSQDSETGGPKSRKPAWGMYYEPVNEDSTPTLQCIGDEFVSICEVLQQVFIFDIVHFNDLVLVLDE